MAISTTREDRTPSGRFVRNLALSLSGGAVLTVLGAGTALAQDGAGTTSDGAGAAHSGDAVAVGNRSGTQGDQGTAASGTLGGLQVVGQTAAVANVGIAVADTGGNTAIGNESQNTAEGTQNALPSLGGATNNGSVGNGSNGTAMVSTGDASAVGNQSGTSLTQHAQGSVGGILLVSQSGAVLNTGVALAQTGGNDATGNTSTNDVGFLQDAATDAGLATNNAKARNTSDGLATIWTGNASAVGNQSDTKVTQSTQGSAGGDDPGGLLLLPQVGLVVNAGLATASTGDNVATGNDSTSTRSGFGEQDAVIGDDSPLDGPLGLASNSLDASNTSDGRAAIRTGDATAHGNDADTALAQHADPSGLVIEPQLAIVANVGVGQASTGDNTAVGNASENQATVIQSALVGQDNFGTAEILAGGIVASNSGEETNTSDGSAEITTGAAQASGNESRTDLSQTANGTIDGLGIILNPQVGLVANVGLGTATTGFNRATGNQADNTIFVDQRAQLASSNGFPLGNVSLTAGLGIASNTGSASNASDGSATIETGAASSTGNHSDTDLTQDATGAIVGAGVVINTQAGVVVNAGLAQANTGDNDAVGNTSLNSLRVGQLAEQGSGNLNDATLTVLGVATAANTASADNATGGDATVRTGAASAVGNESTTTFDQSESGHTPGLVLNTQVGAVGNVGLASANTGRNFATGNAGDSGSSDGGEGSIGAGIQSYQNAQILSRNNDAAPTADLLVVGPSTASNQASLTNATDGTARITTGDAQARGNVSTTSLDQDPTSVVNGLGVVLGTQVAGVANIGVAQANTGDNVADGHTSENATRLNQFAGVGSNNAGLTDFAVVGPATASNSVDAGIQADGTATVVTGDAKATGNASSTDLTQRQSGTVDGLGLVIGTQVGGVANVGLALANTGDNTATGNESENTIDDLDAVNQQPVQQADLNSNSTDPAETVLLGGATASNSLSANHSSDGEACICTGDATASGNISTTTLAQDLDLSTGSGLVVVTQAGGVLNAGLGLANTGVNTAVGNSSSNVIDASQVSTIVDALLEPIDGPQTAANTLDLANVSDGSGHVASGNASGTGNDSTTTFGQEATVDSTLALTTLAGGTTNVGAGIANSGLSSATGNDSVNTLVLEQTADGSGLVANQGEGINESDGTAIIGDPTCCGPDEDVPTDVPGLPRTGGPLETEAVVGLLLLLAGFAFRRRAAATA